MRWPSGKERRVKEREIKVYDRNRGPREKVNELEEHERKEER